MPKKLKSCVGKVKKQGKDDSSAYAICSKSTGWKVGKGSTKKKKKWVKESAEEGKPSSIPEVPPSRLHVPDVSEKDAQKAIKAVKKKYSKTPSKRSSIPKDRPNPPPISDEEGEAAIKAVLNTYKKKTKKESAKKDKEVLNELEALGTLGLGPGQSTGAVHTLRSTGPKRRPKRKKRKKKIHESRSSYRRKKKKRPTKNPVKVKRQGARNPWAYGSSQAAGYGGYTMENKMPTFREFYLH